MKNKKVTVLILCLFVTGFTATSCLAVNSIIDTSNPHYAAGDYDLNDIGTYAVYLMQLILSIVGTLSLAAFIYGGITFLLSAGNPAKVTDGVNAIKAAVIGLIITFASVLIINLFFTGIGVNWNSKTGTVSVPPCGSGTTVGYSCVTDITGKKCVTGDCPGEAGYKCCK